MSDFEKNLEEMAEIPFDSDCGDDYLMSSAFTLNEKYGSPNKSEI